MIGSIFNWHYLSSVRMATSNENLECVICNENLADARALPCGHCYCGPPRSYLSAPKDDFGRMRCAICRIDHNLKPDDIKPVYGIRDDVHESVRIKTMTVFLPCSVHENKECIFWCYTCGIMFCDQCFDEHDDHSNRKLKKHLVKTVEEKLGKSLKEGIVQYRENLHNIFHFKYSELEKLKLHIAEIEEEMEKVEKQIKVLDDYVEISGNGSGDSEHENFLLLGLSNLDMKNQTVLNRIDSTTQTQECITDRIESGTQTVGKHEKKSKSTQIADEIMKITRSTQTELSENELLSTSQIISGGERNVSLSVGSENMSSGTSSISNINWLKEWQEELSDCFCILKHEIGPPPFIFLPKLSVRQRNPLDISSSEFLVICPFQFWINVELVNHKFQPKKKILRFDVNCRHADGEEDEILPASIFQYGLRLRNNKQELNRTKIGSWMYPEYKQLYWYTVTYSEFVNPLNGWIDDDDNVIITLELKPVSFV